MPDLSVIIPMYQAARTIEATVRSALAAADDPRWPVSVEVIVSDDGSRDDGPAIARLLAAGDARVRLITGANAGPSAARNRALPLARGRFIRFLDADDLATPGSHGRLIHLAEVRALPGACGAFELIDAAGCPLGEGRLCPAVPGPDGCIGARELRTGNRFGTGAMVIRREALGSRPFDESMRFCEDWDCWLRMALGSGAAVPGAGPVRWAVMPRGAGPMKQYRVSPGGLSRHAAAMLEGARRVLDRARDAGSPDVHVAALTGQALTYASFEVVSRDTDPALAAGNLLTHAESHAATPEMLAESAMAAILSIPGADRPHALERLQTWWSSLAGSAFLTKTTVEEATRALARRLIDPVAIADALISAATARGHTAVSLFGYGQNGRILAQAAQRAGLRVHIHDDALARDPVACDVCDLPASSVRPVTGAADPASVIIITPENDAAMVARLAEPGRAQVLRWSAARDELLAPPGGASTSTAHPPRLNMPVTGPVGR